MIDWLLREKGQNNELGEHTYTYTQIRKYFSKPDNKNTNDPVKKLTEDLNRNFSKEDIRMANKHMKRCSTSLIIREMQIKTTMRHDLTAVRTTIIKKSTNDKWWRCGEKGLLLYCWWECKLVLSLWKTVWRSLRKLKTELPYDPAILLLGIYLDKTIIQKDTCSPMFNAALFTIAKTWKQRKCPSPDAWIKKMWYIYTMEATQPWKKNEILPSAVTWMDPRLLY